MTLAEFYARVVTIAAELGVEPLSQRQLRDLVDEGALSSPKPVGRGRGQGVGREWTEATLDDVALILRLRKFGERRADQAKAYLWTLGRPVPFDKARLAIEAEFARMVARERRRLGDTEVAQRSSGLKSLARRIGSADPALARFAPSMQEEGAFHVDVLTTLIWGEGHREFERSLSANPDFGALFAIVRDYFTPMFSGALGDVEETDKSALAALQSASEADFLAARMIVQAGLTGWWLITNLASDEPPGQREALQSADRAEWAIAALALAVNLRIKAPEICENFGANWQKIF